VILTINQGSASFKLAAFEDDSLIAHSRVSLHSSDVLPPDMGKPSVVLHRIVHGGEFSRPVQLSAAVRDVLASWSDDVPLHQSAALARVDEATRRWPEASQIGVFDTSWHRTLPMIERVLPLPASWRADGCRRFGFHGIAFAAAHREITRRSPRLAQGRLVLAHLGGGSSVCGVVDGRSYATTMGMTPLAGLPMSTRVGSIDAGVILRRLRLGESVADVANALWRESGMKGLSGLSGDMRELLGSTEQAAAMAVEFFVSAVARAVTSMGTAIGGIDGIVFSGGIGHTSASIRRRIVEQLAWVGVSLDQTDRNDGESLSSADSRIEVHAVDVDEAVEMIWAWKDASETG
jgi:acetate kinase